MPVFPDEAAAVDYQAPHPGVSGRPDHQALERSGGNKSGAARALGLTRLALYHQMKRLGLLKP